MKKSPIFFLFAIMLSFFISCENKDLIVNPNDILLDSVTVSFSPIDSKIILKIREEITPSDRNVKLRCYTEKSYSPSGSKIISSINQVSDTIKINFYELQFSDHGAAIFSPASVEFDLNLLQESSYYLDISINGKKLFGLITVTSESFIFKIQANNIIHFYSDSLLRIPKAIIWGQAGSIEQKPYQLFLDSLEVLDAQPHNLKPGDYYYYIVYPNGSFNLHSALGMPYGQFFLYIFEGDTLITRNLVKRFAKRYIDSIYIQLRGGRGERYYSTVLINEP